VNAIVASLAKDQ